MRIFPYGSGGSPCISKWAGFFIGESGGSIRSEVTHNSHQSSTKWRSQNLSGADGQQQWQSRGLMTAFSPGVNDNGISWEQFYVIFSRSEAIRLRLSAKQLRNGRFGTYTPAIIIQRDIRRAVCLRYHILRAYKRY